MGHPATVIIPNYNGEAYLAELLDALSHQSMASDIIAVDDASTDGSALMLEEAASAGRLTLIRHTENKGFAATANEGVRAAKTPYVILINNDTRPDKDFVREMVFAMRKKKKTFAVSGLMLQMDKPDLIDDCGDLFCAFGWAFSPGRDRPRTSQIRRTRVTSACAGAAIYDRRLFLELGGFDEAHFAYLEDVDLGLRALRRGYLSYYEPDAVLLHKASAVSGSRYNDFKTRLTVGNSLYTIYKNVPAWMFVINFLPMVAGFLVKLVFYARKGFARSYMAGIREGLDKIRHCPFERPVTGKKNLRRDLLLEAELLANCIRRITG